VRVRLVLTESSFGRAYMRYYELHSEDSIKSFESAITKITKVLYKVRMPRYVVDELTGCD
jgi:hypothetical protein